MSKTRLKVLAVLDDNELRLMLLDMSKRYFDELWSPRMEDFNRWRPPGVSRANRQLTKRRLGTSKQDWHDLVLRLTGKEPKPLKRLDPVAPPKPNLPLSQERPYTMYWKRDVFVLSEGMSAIGGYRVVGEWCPKTYQYRPAYCERVFLLK